MAEHHGTAEQIEAELVAKKDALKAAEAAGPKRIVLEGQLGKKGAFLGGSFAPRHMRLWSTGLLEGFKSAAAPKEGTKADNEFDLTKAQVTLHPPFPTGSGAGLTFKYQLTLRLFQDTRIIDRVFEAASLQERDSWVAALSALSPAPEVIIGGAAPAPQPGDETAEASPVATTTAPAVEPAAVAVPSAAAVAAAPASASASTADAAPAAPSTTAAPATEAPPATPPAYVEAGAVPAAPVSTITPASAHLSALAKKVSAHCAAQNWHGAVKIKARHAGVTVAVCVAAAATGAAFDVHDGPVVAAFATASTHIKDASAALKADGLSGMVKADVKFAIGVDSFSLKLKVNSASVQ